MNIQYLTTFLSISLFGINSLCPLTGDSYTIHMPMHLDLNNSGSFVVSVEGNNILEDDTLNIRFADRFTLHDRHGKDDIYGNVSNNDLYFDASNANEKTVYYSIDDVSVGEWFGDLNVTISLDRIEDSSVLKDGSSINKILKSINPNIITFSHDIIDGNYLYDLSLDQDESILLYQNGNEVIITNGKNAPIKSGEDLSSLFARVTNLTTINNLNYIDTSKCTNMSKMFQRSEALTAIDVSGLNTSNVTDMSYMFENCHGCTNIIGLDNLDYAKVRTFKNFMNDDRVLTNMPDIGSWNISSACTDLTAAFKAVGYTSGGEGTSIWPATLDLSNWDVTNVTSLKETLYNAFGVVELNVSSWNTSKVKDMSGFLKMVDSSEESCLTTIIGFEDWDVSKVTTMSNMFYDCINLTNVDFSLWEPRSLTDISNAFYDTLYLDLHIFDNWDQYFNASTIKKTNCFGNHSGDSMSGDYRPEWSK